MDNKITYGRYSQIVHTWMFGQTPLEKTIKYIRQAGANGLDLSITEDGAGSVQVLSKQNVVSLVESNGMQVMATTPLFVGRGLDLSSQEKTIREKAMDFARRAIEVTAACNCGRMLVSPSKIETAPWQPGFEYTKSWMYGVESLAMLAPFAQSCGVSLMIEPINRYRVSLVHTVEEALRMLRQINHPAISIVPDTFHMQMEQEQGIAAAIKQCGSSMACLHVGDSNRRVPGKGKLNWASILKALDEINFKGPLSHEPVSLYFDEQQVAKDAHTRSRFIQELAFGIAFLNAQMSACNKPKC